VPKRQEATVRWFIRLKQHFILLRGIMAIRAPATSAATVAKQWVLSSDLFVESMRETYLWRFAGKDGNSLVRILDNLRKEKGDVINYQLRSKIAGDGFSEGQAAVTNEQALTYYNDSVTINELRQAIRVPGEDTIYTQREYLDQYGDVKPELVRWFAERLDTWFFNHLGAQTVETRGLYNGFNTPTAVDSNHKLVISGTDESALTSSNPMTLAFIDKMLTKAATITNPIRPIRIDGEEFYVLFIHDQQAYDLRTASSGNTWWGIQQNLIQGGYAEKSGIFTGAIGMYNNCIIHKTNRVPYGIQSSAATTASYRSILCGAGAVTLAFGKAVSGSMGENAVPMKVAEETFDYGEERGVCGKLVGGLKAAVFNSTYYGSLIGVTGYTSF